MDINAIRTEEYNRGVNEGIIIGEKRTHERMITSIDKLLDRFNYLRKLLRNCFTIMSKDEVQKKDTERLTVLEAVRNELKELQ